ncbi:hypothetical protein L3X38_012166 [Prunus dulcis]|uniref:Uncharacterized protein n=1 Tax=Prunus dulcis TaxID=3755 RepID=A0AAD4ZFU1_PRUDU|nr:hypothetical protein L3X38_012166 [Prunus dulcis]
MGKPSSMFFVLDKLFEPIDHARFAAVCKEWSCLAEVYNEEPYNPEVIVEKYPADDGRELFVQLTIHIHRTLPPCLNRRHPFLVPFLIFPFHSTNHVFQHSTIGKPSAPYLEKTSTKHIWPKKISTLWLFRSGACSVGFRIQQSVG